MRFAKVSQSACVCFSVATSEEHSAINWSTASCAIWSPSEWTSTAHTPSFSRISVIIEAAADHFMVITWRGSMSVRRPNKLQSAKCSASKTLLGVWKFEHKTRSEMLSKDPRGWTCQAHGLADLSSKSHSPLLSPTAGGPKIKTSQAVEPGYWSYIYISFWVASIAVSALPKGTAVLNKSEISWTECFCYKNWPSSSHSCSFVCWSAQLITSCEWQGKTMKNLWGQCRAHRALAYDRPWRITRRIKPSQLNDSKGAQDSKTSRKHFGHWNQHTQILRYNP